MDSTFLIGTLVIAGVVMSIIKFFKLDDKLNQIIEEMTKRNLDVNDKRNLEEGLVDTPVPSNNWKWNLAGYIAFASVTSIFDLLIQLLVIGTYIPVPWEAIIVYNVTTVACVLICNLRRQYKNAIMKYVACKAMVEVLFRVVSVYQVIPFILGQFITG